MVIDLTVDNNDMISNVGVISLKRVIVDLTYDGDDEVQRVAKRSTHDMKQSQLTTNLHKLPRVLIAKIFKDYLNIDLIKELLKTPTNVLQTSLYIHHSLVSRIVPKSALRDFNTLSRFIMTHIGCNASLFITLAQVNKKVLSSLQINDTFHYYEPHRIGKYVVLKVLKNHAIVQKIRCNDSKLIYSSMIIETVSKISPKKKMNFKILNNRCVFSSLQKQNMCFVNKNGGIVEVSYFTDEGHIIEKHNKMSSYTIIL